MQLFYIALIIFIDHLTKYLAKIKFSSGKELTLIQNYLEFTYVENRGAAFGILKEKKFFLVGFTILAVSYMLYYLVANKNLNKWYRVSLILIISGAIGNLIDRIFRGYVIDFIHFYIKNIFDWPVFNVADISVVLGSILLGISMIFIKE
ncbi:signal peptidase II [Caloramator fervidus]|uniref:Lipoprotein signal peptidase n=1 Tax=Caloramator fervidus TaxID=29344 RepID=A0A1H5TZP1_9CLOT|nr:signal peptidase II [Caloramator fervidus]SEF68314.1 signal peptidase II [Caloramator fervidus]